MTSKIWLLKKYPPDLAHWIHQHYGLSEISAKILSQVGVQQKELLHNFIYPELKTLHKGYLLKNMPQAIERIDLALKRQELICCYGDYDVDGVTGASLLFNFFQTINAKVMLYIPDRIEEGYGLNSDAISKIASFGAKLLITSDCGIRSIKEIEHAKNFGIDVIITDHHEVGDTIPNACAVINPKLPDCPYPFKGISGAAVSLKLAWAVADNLSSIKRNTEAFNDFIMNSLAFATLGTVADLVPLLDENRTIVKFGLNIMRRVKNCGIQALLEVAIGKNKNLTSEDISFQIAPRINAAGRLGRSDLIMKLFTTSSMEEALKIANEMNQLNAERQELEKQCTMEALQQAETLSKKYLHTLVLSDEHWHSGIIGIIASKVLEKYYRPTFVVSFCEETAKGGKGSARSITGYSLPEALTYARDYLVQFGGHSMAAGFQIEKKFLEQFRDKIEEDGRKKLSTDKLIPKVMIDSEINIIDLNENLLDEFLQLEPFGASNPAPILATKNVSVIGSPQVIGKKKNHLKFKIVQHGVVSQVIAFNFADRLQELIQYKAIDIAYHPFVTHWQGQRMIDLQLKDFRKARV